MRASCSSLLVIAAISMVCALPAAAAPEATTARPVLSVSLAGPVVISGTRFKPNERVTLRFVLSGRPLVKIVKATTAGRLVARFVQDVPECMGFTISAVGNRGSRVLFRQVPPPCGIVIQP